jgi:hypothetical protein
VLGTQIKKFELAMKLSEGSIAREISTFDTPFGSGWYSLYHFPGRVSVLIPSFNDLAVVFFFLAIYH